MAEEQLTLFIHSSPTPCPNRWCLPLRSLKSNPSGLQLKSTKKPWAGLCQMGTSLLHFSEADIFIYLLMAVLDLCCCAWAFSSRGNSFLRMGFPLWRLLWLWITGFSSHSSWSLEHRFNSCKDLVAPRHVGTSQIRNQTPISCIGRQIILPLNQQGSLRGKYFWGTYSSGRM